MQLALRTGTRRDVNRSSVDPVIIRQNLADGGSKLSLIRESLGRLLQVRVRQRAFHPNGRQSVLRLSPQVFALLRTSPDGAEHLLALANVSDRPCDLRVPVEQAGVGLVNWYDFVSGRGWSARGGCLSLALGPYDVLWVKPFSEIERDIEQRRLPAAREDVRAAAGPRG